MISEYTSVFNDVISDMLANWDTRLGPDAQRNGFMINDLEKELYNWSIECEYALFDLNMSSLQTKWRHHNS